MDYHGAIERYYRAFRERDFEGLQALLTPHFHFVSSFGEYRERDAMLEEIWPAVGQTWRRISVSSARGQSSSSSTSMRMRPGLSGLR